MNPSVTPLRYPGGKATLINYIEKFLKINNIKVRSVMEPYAGSASMSIGLLKDNLVSEASINDADQMVYSFWRMVLNDNEEFIEMVKSVEVNIDTWLKFRKYLVSDPLNRYNYKEVGFAFLFLNRTSFSGIIKAGPLGGKEQRSSYDIACRFNKDRIIKKILFLGQLSNRISVYNMGGIEFMKKRFKETPDVFIYVDPPYYEIGKQLYNIYFNQKQHEELADYLKSIDEQPWLLSYNNNEFILKLYNDKNTRPIYLDNHSGYYRKNIKEYLFSNRVIPAYKVEENTSQKKFILEY